MPFTSQRAKFAVSSVVVGVGTVIGLFVLAQFGIFENLAGALLSPGLLLAGVAGFGAHDAAAYLLIIVGDVLLYAAICFVVLSAISSRRARQKQHQPPSLTSNQP